MILFLFYLNELYSCLSNLDDTSRTLVIYDFRASTCILRPRSWKCTSMHLRTRLAYSQCASIRLHSSEPPSPFSSRPIFAQILSFFSPHTHTHTLSLSLSVSQISAWQIFSTWLSRIFLSRLKFAEEGNLVVPNVGKQQRAT